MAVLPKVVAVVTSPEEASGAIALGADILEVRVDLSKEEPRALVEDIFKLGKPLIVTIRPTWEGGAFAGSGRERAELIKSLAPFADYVDVELRAKNLDGLVSSVEGSEALVIVSYHDFEGTPPKKEMLSILRECHAKGDIAKLAIMPRDLEDVLALLDVTLKAPKPVCTIAMGDTGMHSRIMAPVYGSLLTYGYVSKPVAPGQVRVDKIIEGLGLLGLK